MIINSLLSQDVYKLTMLQFFYYKFRYTSAKYRFKCRNKGINLLDYKDEIYKEIEYLCTLNYTDEELTYLESLGYFKPEFLNYLKTYQLSTVDINLAEKDKNLDIMMYGLLVDTSPFEIFVLKIVHEIYTRKVNLSLSGLELDEGRKRLNKKINDFKEFTKNEGYKPNVIDFGGRRAFTTKYHEFVVKTLKDNDIITGTSDIDLARRYNLMPVGTMAHEFIQTYQSVVDPLQSQSKALYEWINFYDGKLGIALSDTLGDKKFLMDFNYELANRYSGVRHDSGDPIVWGDMMLKHYYSFGIDPKEKTLVFSDGLDFPTMFKLAKYFKDKVKISFGIGTNLTNDLGVPALQNVIKQIECNWKPTAKLSNNPDKTMCEDFDYLECLKKKLNDEV
jgi:nicotinate phosphoribosyltransferase